MAEVEANISETARKLNLKKHIGIRHYQFLLMFFANFIPFVMRTSLSIAIISMTSKTSSDDRIPTYSEWDNTDLILSSFSWGMVISLIAGGKLQEMLGPKYVLVISTLVGSIANILIPPLAGALGPTGVMLCRVIQGFTQGFANPSFHGLISAWSPVFERSRVTNFVYSGGSLGIAVSMPLTGVICGSKMGCPAVFYVFGAVGVAWSVVFAIFAQNSPTEHRTISKEEMAHIQSGNAMTQVVKRRVSTPWFSIVTSLPIWAILIAGISYIFSGYIFLTEMPTYLFNVMNYDIKSNSVLSSLPYFVFSLLSLLSSLLADKLVQKEFLSLTATRKVFNSLASFLPAAALIYLAYIDSSQKILAIVLLVIAVAFTSLTTSGYTTNIIDVAPNHAGMLLGLTNGIGNFFSIFAPLTVQFLGDDKTDPILWRKVFLLNAGILIGGGLFYDAFTTAELQPWNEIEETEKNKEQCDS